MKDAESAKFKKAHEEAAEWVIKKSIGLNEYEEEVFNRWLASDPLHRERMRAHQRVWEDADLLRDLVSRDNGEASALENLERFPIPKRKRWVRRPALAFAVAASLALGIVCLRLFDAAPVERQTFEQTYAAHSLERHFLPDGSLVEMKQGSRMLVRYDADARHVSLETGEAHFSVMRDAGRPFIVDARGAQFRALGTAFAVSVEDVEVKLLVTEGKVRMSAPRTAERPDERGGGIAFEQDLTVRKQATVRLDDPRVVPIIEEIETEEMDRTLVWKHEVLDFEATPLAEAIMEFNSRNRDQMKLASSAIGTIAIDGRFRSDNLLAFVRLIEVSAGVKARQDDDGFITLYRE